LADPLGQLAGYVNEQFSGADYVQALRVRAHFAEENGPMFDTFDYLVRRAQPVAATPLDMNLRLGFLSPILWAHRNLCGLPAISFLRFHR